MPLDRRDFLKLGPAAMAVAAASGREADAQPTPSTPFAAPPIPLVRIGFVGIGGQGGSHVENLLKIPGCRITAVCDVRPERTDVGDASRSPPAGHPAPAVYTRGPRDFERLCETEELDLVFNATPWEWHVPIMLAAMKNGKHAATEVPAAMTLDDCWALVEAAEKYREALRDDGELQLRPHGDDGLQHGPPGPVRRDPPRRGRLSARPARRSSSQTAAKGCGGAPGRRSSTATSIRRTASVRSPTASTSTAAIASTTSSR